VANTTLSTIETTKGLVLRSRPLTETSLIVHWLTPDVGRIATVAKGARRPKSPFRGKLDLFFEAEFSFRRSRHSDLHTLLEVRLQETHAGLREDLAQLQQACYFVELLEKTTEQDTPLPSQYALLRESLAFLSAAPAEPKTVLAFELKLLADAGLQPNFEQSGLTAGAVQIAGLLAANEWSKIRNLKLSAEQLQELSRFLRSCVESELGRMPRNREVALGNSS
jgi:DNA repair protein RecO (recombination protein O)